MLTCDDVRVTLGFSRAIVASACKPDMTPEEVEAATLELRAYLHRITGHEPVDCLGVYQGQSEPSLLVPVTGGFQAFAIARKVCGSWRQDSILACDDSEGFILSVPEDDGPVMVDDIGRIVYAESPEGMTRVLCDDGVVTFHYRSE